MRNLLLAAASACLFFGTSCGQSTQHLRVGDPAPPLRVYKWVKGQSFTALQKGKIHVVEFGATWCKPCLKAIPDLTAIARKYGEGVNVIGIFVMEYKEKKTSAGPPAYISRVEKYVENQGTNMAYNVGVDGPEETVEKEWILAAGKNGIPHTFVVDRNGTIAWIGSNTRDLEAVIEKVMDKNYEVSDAIEWAAELQEKTTPYDPFKLLLIDGNGGAPEDFLYRSMLTIYKGDIKTPPPLFISNHQWASEDSPHFNCRGRVQATGATLLDLYQLAYSDTLWNQISIRTTDGIFLDSTTNPYQKSAYGKYWYEPLLEVKDVSPFTTSYRSPANKFNYSLQVPPAMGTAHYLQEVMRRDLRNYFGYIVSVEERLMPCWKLKANKNAAAMATKTPGMAYRRIVKNNGVIEYKNALVLDVISKLGTFYGFGMLNYGRIPREDIAPFVDETGIPFEIDFTINSKEKENFQTFRESLSRQGIDLVKETKKMKVVVIREPNE